jgi:hypothetical protein
VPAKKNGQIIEIKRRIAEFCGVIPRSVEAWLQKKSPLPRGETLIKLMCCLDSAGFRVIELERLPAARRGFAELIGFSILSNDQACAQVGYADKSALYQVFRGKQGVNKEKSQSMFEIWKINRLALETRQNMAARELKLDNFCQIHRRPEEADQTSLSLAAAESPPPRQPAIIKFMEGLLALLAGDRAGFLPKEEFEDLRLNADIVLRLSSRLSDLSSRLIKTEQNRGGG